MNKTVVFVNSIPPQIFGGGEKWMSQVAKALSDKGYQVGLIARPQSKIIEKFREFNSVIYPLTFGSDFNPINIFKVFEFLKKINASYLILNFNKDVSIAGIAGRLARVEKIIFRNGFPLIHNKLKHRILLPFFDTLVSNSLALVNHYSAYGWGLENKMKVIYNGIEVCSDFTRNYEKEKGKAYFIFGSGRLTEIKRFNIFLDVIARLKKEFSIRAVIAGEGPEINNLKLLSDALEADVEFVGYVQAMQPLFKKADVFLHTSRNEGVPNVVMEAMSYGLPVVVTNAGGTNELVNDNVNGFLCDIDDIEGLYQKVRSLLSDVKLRKKLGQKAQETIKAHFSFKHLMDQMESLFN